MLAIFLLALFGEGGVETGTHALVPLTPRPALALTHVGDPFDAAALSAQQRFSREALHRCQSPRSHYSETHFVSHEFTGNLDSVISKLLFDHGGRRRSLKLRQSY